MPDKSGDSIKLTLPHFEKKNKTARSWIWLACALVLLALAGTGFWWWQGQITDSLATVESATAPLIAGADGRVQEAAALNDTVQAGQVVVQLDNAPFVARLEEARARLAAVTPGQESSASVRQAEERLQASVEKSRQLEVQARRDMEHFSSLHAQALLALRRPDLQRAGAERLNNAKLAEIEARVNLDNARTAFNTQSRARTLAEGDLARFRKDMQAVAQMAQNPEVLARVQEVLAQRLREAEAALAATVVLAPQEGRISRLAAAPGTLVHAGQVLGDVTPSRVRILAHVSAANAARLSAGQPVRARFGGLAELPFTDGVVSAILPPDGQDRVPVRVEVAAPPAGMPAQGSVAEVKFLKFLF